MMVMAFFWTTSDWTRESRLGRETSMVVLVSVRFWGARGLKRKDEGTSQFASQIRSLARGGKQLTCPSCSSSCASSQPPRTPSPCSFLQRRLLLDSLGTTHSRSSSAPPAEACSSSTTRTRLRRWFPLPR